MPSIGRFTQYDPIGTTNPYIYAGNNPISWVDPSGNQEVIEFYTFMTALAVAAFIIYQSISNNSKTWNIGSFCMFSKRKQVSINFPTRKRAQDARDTKGKPGGKKNKPEKHGDGPWHYHDRNHNDPTKPNIHYNFPE